MRWEFSSTPCRTSGCEGVINAVGPRPVSNAEFTRELALAMRRPGFLPAPKAMLRLAFGEMSEILTASQRVLPREATRSGYTFKHGELAGALATALAEASKPSG